MIRLHFFHFCLSLPDSSQPYLALNSHQIQIAKLNKIHKPIQRKWQASVSFVESPIKGMGWADCFVGQPEGVCMKTQVWAGREGQPRGGKLGSFCIKIGIYWCYGNWSSGRGLRIVKDRINSCTLGAKTPRALIMLPYCKGHQVAGRSLFNVLLHISLPLPT